MKLFINIFAILGLMTSVACLEGGAGPKGDKTPAAAKVEKAEAPKEVPQAVEAPSGGQDPVLAIVNGEEIKDSEVYQTVKPRLKKLESQIFDIKRSGLTGVIEDKLVEMEAKKKGVSSDELLKTEVYSKVGQPSDKEIEAFYNAMKSRLGGQTLDQVKGRIIAQLSSSNRQEAYNEYVGKLKKDAKIEVKMERPRVEVSVDDDPSRGKKDGKITMIEFTDYQCPFCHRARATINQILDTYSEVHYVQRDFPLSFHKDSPKAHEAANCAGEQDKYFEYSKLLWDNQRSLKVDSLKEYAQQAGLDTAKFNECLDSGKFAAEVQKDIQDGTKAGVSGTPAYFINGIFISGAQPFENFAEIIDEELGR